jgi:hypothetical protein
LALVGCRTTHRALSLVDKAILLQLVWLLLQAEVQRALISKDQAEP